MLRRKAKGKGAMAPGNAYCEDKRCSIKTKHCQTTARCSDDVDDKQLEELVFGKQLFSAESRNLFSSESDASDTEDIHSEVDVIEAQTRKKMLQEDSVWHDDDDDTIRVDLSSASLKCLSKTDEERTVTGSEYSRRLRSKFEQLSGQPEWALPRKRPLSEDSSDEDGDDKGSLLQRTGNFLARSQTLVKGTLDICTLKDVNIKKRAPAVLQSVEFHPSANVVLTAGLHKTVDFFQVDGESNQLLDSLHLERFPIVTAHFTPNGEEVIVAGQRKWFYVFDIRSGHVKRIKEIRGHSEKSFTTFSVSPDNQFLAFLGNDGYIPLVSNKTKQWVADLKMNGTVKTVAFTPNSQYLLSSGGDGQVYVWDLSTRDCVHRFVDDGCVIGTALAISPSGRFFACGSNSGVVNIYDETCLHMRKPTPLKALMNLTTCVDALTFNAASEILAMSSSRKKHALKLVHVSSLSVFSNWPTYRTPLGHIFSHSFSQDNCFLATGNDHGHAHLYRFSHYCDALRN